MTTDKEKLRREIMEHMFSQGFVVEFSKKLIARNMEEYDEVIKTINELKARSKLTYWT